MEEIMRVAGKTSDQNNWSFENTARFLVKWTPRAIAVGLGAYYGLGVAYGIGLMALIDKVAILILKRWVGYVGVGAAMPTFQWYASIIVRGGMALIAGALYDGGERLVRYFYARMCHKPQLARTI
jgi:hypothetical protein